MNNRPRRFPIRTLRILWIQFIWLLVVTAAAKTEAAISPTGDVAPTYPVGHPDPWNVGDELIVADSANGSLSISGGSDVLTFGGTQGFNPLTTGIVTVTGSGSTWINNQDLFLGVFGSGKLDVLKGGRVENRDAFVGHVNGLGQVIVSGAGSVWQSAQDVVIGNSGHGQLTIQQEGRVHSNNARIGLNNTALGTVVVDGQQSTWDVNHLLSVGDIANGGTASLFLTGAGSRVYIGAAAISQSIALPPSQTAIVVSATGGTAQLAIYGGNTVQNSGSAQLGVGPGESGTVLVHGSTSMWSNGGDIAVGVTGAGTLSLAHGGAVSSGGTIAVGPQGLLNGFGTVSGMVTNSGTVAPGQSIGSLTVTGDFSQSTTVRLFAELAGVTAGTFDVLIVSAQATLAGKLEVEVGLNGGSPFVPQLGNLFPVLSASSIIGRFTSADLPTLAAGRMWQVRYSATTATLAVTLAGDYNDNGVVDAADYVVWRNLLGTTDDPRADGDTNGIVDAADYQIWKANFGSIVGAGAKALAQSATVPEPATTLYILTMLAMLSTRNRAPRC